MVVVQPRDTVDGNQKSGIYSLTMLKLVGVIPFFTTGFFGYILSVVGLGISEPSTVGLNDSYSWGLR